jgi:hypothetical protein
MRIFDKVNSGLVFEAFYLLDTEVSPLISIVASDASHQGNSVQHPLYRKSGQLAFGSNSTYYVINISKMYWSGRLLAKFA